MKKFRTTFPIPKSEPFGYNDSILLCGSCFVENIGKKLKNAYFKTMINPFGILFNPVSLAHSFDFILGKKTFQKEDLLFHNNLYYSFFHHSCLAQPDANTYMMHIQQITQNTRFFLKNAKYLFLTLGTAWVYEDKSTQTVVSSCHKIPQQQFNKQLLTIENIVTLLKKTFYDIQKYNLNIKIVLTISPVRHIKDGFIENQQSKATLILAVKQLLEECNECFYFPAYELMMDDLRDYRFYASDMLHPSEIAIQYIWEYFCETYFSVETLKTLAEAEALYTAFQHRPFQTGADEYKSFCKTNHEKAKELAQRFPYAKFSSIFEDSH